MIKRLILSTLVLAGLVACSGKKEKTNQEEIVKVPVRVQTLKNEVVSRTLVYSANLVADEEVHYAPASAGRIDKIHVEVGDKITKGQLLVTMDPTQLKQAEFEYKNLKAEYDRAVALKKTGSISNQSYDATITKYEVAKANYEFMKENAKLESPFNGIVTGKYYEDGELYTGSPNTSASKAAVVTIEKNDYIKAFVNMSEQYYTNLKKGVKVELKTHIYGAEVFEGEVSNVYPTIDRTTRTFVVEVRIPNKDKKLRSGMSGSIEFFVGEETTMIVPALAVLKLQGSNVRYVFINDNGIAKRIDVTIGKRFEDRVEIIGEGINEGTQIVTTGQARLVEGSHLDIQK